MLADLAPEWLLVSDGGAQVLQEAAFTGSANAHGLARGTLGHDWSSKCDVSDNFNTVVTIFKTMALGRRRGVGCKLTVIAGLTLG